MFCKLEKCCAEKVACVPGSTLTSFPDQVTLLSSCLALPISPFTRLVASVTLLPSMTHAISNTTVPLCHICTTWGEAEAVMPRAAVLLPFATLSEIVCSIWLVRSSPCTMFVSVVSSSGLVYFMITVVGAPPTMTLLDRTMPKPPLDADCRGCTLWTLNLRGVTPPSLHCCTSAYRPCRSCNRDQGGGDAQ